MEHVEAPDVGVRAQPVRLGPLRDQRRVVPDAPHVRGAERDRVYVREAQPGAVDFRAGRESVNAGGVGGEEGAVAAGGGDGDVDLVEDGGFGDGSSLVGGSKSGSGKFVQGCEPCFSKVCRENWAPSASEC